MWNVVTASGSTTAAGRCSVFEAHRGEAGLPGWSAAERGRRERVASDPSREVFQGCPEMKGGYLHANEAPGWGIEVDERAAAKYPFGFGERGERRQLDGGRGAIRRRDGTIIRQ